MTRSYVCLSALAVLVLFVEPGAVCQPAVYTSDG